MVTVYNFLITCAWVVDNLMTLRYNPVSFLHRKVQLMIPKLSYLCGVSCLSFMLQQAKKYPKTTA